MKEERNQRLRYERELRGISLEQMTQRTRISIQHLQAIEKGDFSRLPQGKLLRSLIVSYIKCLGLDPQEVLIDLDLPHLLTASTPCKSDDSRPTLTPFILGFFMFLTILLIWSALSDKMNLFTSEDSDDHESSTFRLPGTPDVLDHLSAWSAENVSLESWDYADIPTVIIESQDGVILKAIDATWIKIFSISEGQSVLEMLPARGMRHYLPDGEMIMEIGDPSAVKLTVNGEDLTQKFHDRPLQIRFVNERNSAIIEKMIDATEGGR